MRLDFAYQIDPDEVVFPFTAREIERHRDNLFRYVKRRFPHYVGGIWKLEFGEIKKFHFHVILFFDGQAMRQGITVGQIVGEYWRDKITKEAGTYWNVNKSESTYERRNLRGIGLIAHSDHQRRRNLVSVTNYLAKVDLFVRLESPGIGRTIGKSQMKAKETSRRGRPRYCVPRLLSELPVRAGMTRHLPPRDASSSRAAPSEDA